MLNSFPDRHLRLAFALLLNGLAAFGQSPINYSNNATITVPDSGGGFTSSSIVVSGFSGSVAKVTVTLNSMTGRIGETDYLLVAPNNAKVVFLSNAGSIGTSSSNVTATFDDSASSFAPTGVMTTGTAYKPTHNGSSAEIWPAGVPAPSYPSDYAAGNTAGTGTATFANHFNGINPNGTWILYAIDDVAGDTSITISGWTLSITPAVLPATTTSVSATSNPATRTVPVSLNATITSGSGTVNEGSVQFTNNGANLGSPVTVTNGAATLANQVFNSEGAFVIGASYSGGATFSPSSGNFTLAVQSATTGTPPTFCNAGPVTINSGASAPIPATPYPQRITVSGLSGTLSKVTVALNGFSHPTPADVDMLLVSPSGQKMLVFSDLGGSIAASNLSFTLDDSASNNLPGSSALSGGLYKPTDFDASDTFAAPAPAGPYNHAAPAASATLTSSFAGTDPNGTWLLYVSEDIPGNTGSISGGYCLTFTTSGDSSTTTALSSSLNPAFTGQAITYTATAQRTSDSSPVPGGTMVFSVDGTAVTGALPVNASGSATYQTSSLPEGTHTILATYSGTSGYATSNATLQQEVNTATTVTGTTYCNNGGIAVNGTGSASVYPSRIFVSNLAGAVSSVRLKLNSFSISHSTDNDMLLVGPAGQTLVPWSGIGGSGSFSNQNFILSDAAASTLPATGTVTGGTYLPSAYNEGFPLTFPSPAPSPPYNVAATQGTATLGSVFGGIDPNGTWSLFITDHLPDPGSAGNVGSWCLDFTMAVPNLTITKTHSGNFSQGQTGAAYTIKVKNSGTGPTAGAVTVTEAVPTGMTLTGLSGSGWDCSAGTSCTRSDALSPDSFYPDINVSVNVAANAGASLTNTATVSGGGETNTSDDTATDVTVITPTITFDTNPTGLSFSVGGINYSGAQIQQIPSGTNTTIATTSPQPAPGTQYVFQSWSDGGAISHGVTIGNTITSYIANFQTQYQLTTSANPVAGGQVTPATGGFYNAGTSVAVSATANACYVFSSWSPNVSAGSVSMSGPQAVVATFSPSIATNVTSQLNPVYGGFRLNRATNKWMQAVTLTNSGAALNGIVFALDNLSATATLNGAGGNTSCAVPVAPYRAIGPLGAGASVTFYLQFDNPTTGPIRYTGRLLAAPGQL